MPQPPSPTAVNVEEIYVQKKSLRERFHSKLPIRTRAVPDNATNNLNCPTEETESIIGETSAEVKALITSSSTESNYCFWPRDLLSKECPLARILTWGYDTQVTKYFTGATNKSSILSHGQDLLFALRQARINRARVHGAQLRDSQDSVYQAGIKKVRIIFVAHSLGGIVVKEARPNRQNRFPVKATN